MRKTHTKEIIFAISSVILLIIITIGVSLAVFTYSRAGSQSNTISTGTITFTYSEDSNGIELVNAIPMTDTAGKVLIASEEDQGVIQGYFDFSVSATMSSSVPIVYEIYGTVESESTMDSNYIKTYLTNVDGSDETPVEGYNGQEVPVYGSLVAATSNPTGKRLYTDTFTSSTTKNFRLRLWVASSYTTTDVSNKFIMRVNVATIDE